MQVKTAKVRGCQTLGYAGNSGKLVETCIKTEDSIDSMIFHYSEVDSTARGQPRVPQHNIFGALDRSPIHGQDLIDHATQGIKCRLNGIAPANRNVAVQDFLQDFRIRYQPLALAD